LSVRQLSQNVPASSVELRVPAGLSQVDAKRRLAEYGYNEPAPAKRTAPLFQLLILVANPLAIILLVASGISAALGQVINASIIVTMVLLSVALNFIQTFRSQKAVDSIRKEVAPTANVLRDDKWMQIPRREIVPGDVIKLAAGDMVPADAELVQTRDLHVQQAALTGESLPVEKSAISDHSSDSETDSHKVFLGTSVVSGTATANVIATGKNTVFGDIATRLAKRAPETEFERGTRRFGFLIMRTTIFLVLFVLLVSVVFHRPLLESLLFAVALAVGLTPEFLPMITTVTLGRGAVHMARKNVIVKHLDAMQNFGSIDVLCSDKTGTLTTGEMSLEQHVDPFGAPAERVFVLAYLNSLHETGIPNPLDEAIKERHRSDPLDTAVLKHDHPDIHDYQKVDEIPFDFERRRVSIVVKHNEETLLITKGAPESVLSVCTAYEVDGQQHTVDEAARARIATTYRDLCTKGYRTLAVAYRNVPGLCKVATLADIEKQGWSLNPGRYVGGQYRLDACPDLLVPSGVLGVLDGGQPALRPRLPVGGRGPVGGQLRELGGQSGRAPASGLGGRLNQRHRDGLVLDRPGRGQMPGPLDRIGEYLGEPGVGGQPHGHGRALVDDGTHQRMAEVARVSHHVREQVVQRSFQRLRIDNGLCAFG